MPFCQDCGREHRDTARFCPGCGQAVQQEQPASQPATPPVQPVNQPPPQTVQPATRPEPSPTLKRARSWWAALPTAQKVLVIGAVSFTVILIAVSAGAASEESSSDEPTTTANPASPALPLATTKAAKPPATAVWPPANQQASGASQPLQPILTPNPMEQSNINRQSATREPTEVTRPLHTYEVFHDTRNNEDQHGISIYIEENEDLTDGDLYRIALAKYQKARELGKSEDLLGAVYPRWDYFTDFYSDREIARNSTCFEEPNEFGFYAPCGGTYASDDPSYLGSASFLDGNRIMIRTFFTKSELTESLSRWSNNSGPLDLEPLLQEDLNNIRKVVYIIEPETDMCTIAQQVSQEHDGSREAVHIYFLPEDNRHAYELLANDQGFLDSVNEHTAATIQIRLEPSTIYAKGPKTWGWSFRKVASKWDKKNQDPVCQGDGNGARTAAVTPSSRLEETKEAEEQPESPQPSTSTVPGEVLLVTTPSGELGYRRTDNGESVDEIRYVFQGQQLREDPVEIQVRDGYLCYSLTGAMAGGWEIWLEHDSTLFENDPWISTSLIYESLGATGSASCVIVFQRLDRWDMRSRADADLDGPWSYEAGGMKFRTPGAYRDDNTMLIVCTSAAYRNRGCEE